MLPNLAAFLRMLSRVAFPRDTPALAEDDRAVTTGTAGAAKPGQHHAADSAPTQDGDAAVAVEDVVEPEIDRAGRRRRRIGRAVARLRPKRNPPSPQGPDDAGETPPADEPEPSRSDPAPETDVPVAGNEVVEPEATEPASPAPPTEPATSRRWFVQLGLVALLGLAVRVVYVLVLKPAYRLSGDAYYYHNGANLLARGHDFIVPSNYLLHHQVLPAAPHPPGYLLTLTVPSLFGLDTVLAHQIWSCLLGTVTVVLIALIGRSIGTPRVGLIAAVLAAVYPNLWLNDSVVMSETLILLTTAVVILVAYRFVRRPGPAIAAGLGVAVGAAALTRAESILLIPLLGLALPCLARQFSWRRRAGLAAISLAATVIVVGPWVGYNLTRFEHPVTLSTNLGVTLRVSNCDRTYSGSALGYSDLKCMAETRPGGGDPSSQELAYRRDALDYIKAHLGRAPVVAFARLGRAWGLFRPLQTIDLDNYFDWQDIDAARLGLAMYYVLLIAAVPGLVLLRRRRVALLPLLAPAITVTIAVAATLGETRLRAPAEVAIVVLAALGIDATWRVLRTASARPAPEPQLALNLWGPQATDDTAGGGIDSQLTHTAAAPPPSPTPVPSRESRIRWWAPSPSGPVAPATATAAAATPERRGLRAGCGAAIVLAAIAVVVGSVVVTTGSSAGTKAHTARPPAGPAIPARIVRYPSGQLQAADPSHPARIIDPRRDRPNPFVLVANGKYYMYASQTSSLTSPTIPVWVSTDFTNWSPVRDALPVLPSWATWGSTWSPDVRLIHGRYVMYYTALVKGSLPDTRCIGTATARRPIGPFRPVQQPLICQRYHRGSIDPRTFEDTDGTLWMIWKADDNANANGSSRTGIYAQRVTHDGLRLVGARTLILRADRAWEGRIVEAPQMVRANGKYYLFYSGNWYNQPRYAIGVAVCSRPTGPCVKRRPARPFIQSNGQGLGPGESSLFTDREGLWIIYAPWAVDYQFNTVRPVALAHVALSGLGPYLAAF